jgi:Sec-independent protein translocase protein TatA
MPVTITDLELRGIASLMGRLIRENKETLEKQIAERDVKIADLENRLTKLEHQQEIEHQQELARMDRNRRQFLG